MLVCMKTFADLSVWFTFSVRLTRVTQRTNNTIVGVVQLFKNNQWNYICGTFFDDVDAGVVCRKMGYSHYRALPAGALGSVYFYRNVAGGVNCTGTESSLGRCPLQMGACSNRNRLNYGAVICSKVTIPRGECMEVKQYVFCFVLNICFTLLVFLRKAGSCWQFDCYCRHLQQITIPRGECMKYSKLKESMSFWKEQARVEEWLLLCEVNNLCVCKAVRNSRTLITSFDHSVFNVVCVRVCKP